MSDLRIAIEAHQKNNLPLAKQLYQQHLHKFKNDANANQLLAVIFLGEGDIVTAISHLQLSLKVAPKQPHVWCNLAVCFNRQGRTEQAIACYEKALSYDKKNVTAYKDLAKILRTKKDFVQANNVINRADGYLANNPDITAEKVKLYTAQERNTELISLFRQLQANGCLTQQYCFNLALLLRIEGQAKQALSYFQQLVQQGMDNYQLNHNLGNVYSDLGELPLAIEYYQKSIAHNPLYLESHINLNELLWEVGRTDQFLSSYVQVLAIHPADAGLNFTYVKALVRTKNIEQAKYFLTNLPSALKSSADFYYLMGQCLLLEKKYSEALACQQQGINLIDTQGMHVVNYAKNLIKCSQSEVAQAILLAYLKQHPDDQLAIACLGVCWRLDNNQQEQLINNYQHMVKVYDVVTPDNEQSVEDYCQQLNHYLSQLHTATQQPLEQTLYKGTQTRGNLFDDNNPVITDLVNKLSLCIDAYINDMPNNSSPYSVTKAEQYRFAGSWSARLNKEGYHGVHVHPMGWLSAVFYVEVPRTDHLAIEDKAGWLKFGESDLIDASVLPAVHLVQPKVGQVVIFPSYMWHGTVPLVHNGQRTTIAFDIEKVTAR